MYDDKVSEMFETKKNDILHSKISDDNVGVRLLCSVQDIFGSDEQMSTWSISSTLRWSY